MIILKNQVLITKKLKKDMFHKKKFVKYEINSMVLNITDLTTVRKWSKL